MEQAIDVAPELLAPAGTIEAGLTALDAGADAVYAGLSRFNARERGQNFTLEQLSKLLELAHGRGRRVYVTLNTLLKEDELDQVAELLVELALIRPDAVIVQDLGLLRLLREHFAELEVHASTQLALHNSAGLALVERLGVRRAILERQVTWEELRAIRARTSLELEIFVHGALCCSRSGLCLLSSWLGGHSGNRGRCKQPCRRRYGSGRGEGFFLSPGDLCALSDVAELRRLGVKALKIEGRLRRPDYVRRVVAAYRLLLDAPVEELERLRPEAEAILAGAFGRPALRPFREASDLETAILADRPGAAGRPVGVVRAVERGRLGLELSERIGLYDTLRLQPPSGDEGVAVTVTGLAVGARPVKVAGPGQRVWIACGERVEPGSAVFRTGSTTDSLAPRVSALPLARPVVDLSIVIGEGSIAVETSPVRLSWSASAPFEPALRRPITAGEVAGQFRKAGASPLAAGRVDVELAGELFLPAAALKALRRHFWAWAAGALDEGALRAAWERRRSELGQRRAALSFPAGARPVETTVIVPAGRSNPLEGAVTARWIDQEPAPGEEVVLPDFCGELELEDLARRVDELVQRGQRRFRATSLHGLALLRGRTGLEVTASFPLPACNSLAVAELVSLGATRVTAWVELEREAIERLLERCGGVLELLTYGRLPLLSTRLSIPAEGTLTDNRGARFELVRERGLTNLYAEAALSLAERSGTSSLIDLSHAELQSHPTADFNDRRGLA